MKDVLEPGTVPKREAFIKCIDTMNHLEELRIEQTRVMLEMKRCFHFMVFWPEGYRKLNAKGETENPKLTYTSGPGHPFLRFTLRMEREDLGESRTFHFKLRSTRRIPEADAPGHWKCITPDYSSAQRMSVEPPDVHVSYSKFIILLESIEGEDGLDPKDIPHECVVAVTKNFIEKSY